MENKLRFISIAYVILLSIGLFAHVEIIPLLLTIVKRDAWVCILLTLPFLPVWIYLLYKLVSIINKKSIIDFYVITEAHSFIPFYFSHLRYTCLLMRLLQPRTLFIGHN
ncbi:hypothetical protein [Neobacillus jeddahensis]|uniref:hypothetical protein n=1 Tax=Neobacillus jeddahensis TaxID=1461580 RepID=UPI00058BD109|nr:hypothetical protein [Neobacillus jeddahensis]